ncbi:MAG: pilus assembly protein PilB, partial [Planctomycetes bacterium]|nr:pilus assembly protein PilB [Planctomycetota bacterium]
MGLLTRDKVHAALKFQKKQGGKPKLGEILIEKGIINEKQLDVALAGQRGMVYVDIAKIDIAADVISQIPAHMAKNYRVIPLEYDDGKNELTVVLDSPDNFRATDDLSTLLGFKVKAKVTSKDEIEDSLNKYYAEEDSSINDLIGELEGDSELSQFQGRDASIDLDELKELADSNPVKKLLNLVLLQAIRDKASDVHFEP